MEKYITQLKDLTLNFSYQQFLELIKKIDLEVINGNIQHFNSEFIYYFNQIISMVNDNYLIDNKPGTLGHMLIENALIQKEKITPTLAICFFLEQKHNLGLDSICNDMTFFASRKNSCMYVDDSDNGLININWNYYSNLKENVDEYNYKMMSTMLHELTHIYQYTRTEETNNIFDKLVYYDYQQLKNLQQYGEGYSTIYREHQSMLSEFMADEQAQVFMLQLAKNHPEYFNKELIEQQQALYENRKNGTYGNYGADPRSSEAKFISEIMEFIVNSKNDYEELSKTNDPEFLKQLLKQYDAILVKANEIDKKRIPLIAQLQMQGISEKGLDSYYNIFLKSFYKFDGQNIILYGDNQEEVKKKY